MIHWEPYTYCIREVGVVTFISTWQVSIKVIVQMILTFFGYLMI